MVVNTQLIEDAEKVIENKEEINKCIKERDEALRLKLKEAAQVERDFENAREYRERKGICHSAQSMYGWD